MTTSKSCPQCGASYDAEQRFCALDGAALRGRSADGDLAGEVVAGRYLVRRRLGEGGMGEVYLAEHVRMGRPCALKVMRAELAANVDAVARFNREAAHASRVSHRNVAAIYDFGESESGLVYLSMELVEGEPLRALLERAGRLPAARALAVVAQVADALDAAHALGIVHRDLKPDNVMIARERDGTELVKVVDFGIAKASDGETRHVTRTGRIVGTPEYMSPEQLAGDPTDHRADVYALALLAYALLTGDQPFAAETAQDTLVQRLTTAPRRLAELCPEVPWPTAVQAALDRALARKPAERQASAGALARDLVEAYGRAGAAVAGVVEAARHATAGDHGMARVAAAHDARTLVDAPRIVVPLAAASAPSAAASAVPPTRVFELGGVRAGRAAAPSSPAARWVRGLAVGVAGAAITLALAAAQLRSPRTAAASAALPAAAMATRPPGDASAATAADAADPEVPSHTPARPAPAAAPVPAAAPTAARAAGPPPTVGPDPMAELVERVQTVIDASVEAPDTLALLRALREVEHARAALDADDRRRLRLDVARGTLLGLAGRGDEACAQLLAVGADPRLPSVLAPTLLAEVRLLEDSCR